MWYKSVNKKQFRTYVMQDARLNIAYHTTAKALQICEKEVTDFSVEKEIISMNQKILNLLATVDEELSSQKGLTKDLIKQHLEYVKSFYELSVKSSMRSSKQSHLRFEVSNLEEHKMKEMSFIRNRSNMIWQEDLLEDFDRGIYLIYQASDFFTEGLEKPDVRSMIKQRLSAATDIMSPGFKTIQTYCGEYIAHLDLDSVKSLNLINQQIVDCSALFSSGCSLARFLYKLIKFFEDTPQENWNAEKLKRLEKYIEVRSNSLQSDLIESSLARATNIEKALSSDSIMADGKAFLCSHL